MSWNELLPELNMPLVKGTSFENEKASELEREMEDVLWNEFLPVVNVVN